MIELCVIAGPADVACDDPEGMRVTYGSVTVTVQCIAPFAGDLESNSVCKFFMPVYCINILLLQGQHT
jgi:hypothetical protein